MKTMALFIGCLGIYLFLVSTAFASSELEITKIETGPDTINLELIATDISEQSEFNAILTKSKESLSTNVEPLPMNLWILVDSSTICHAKKVDQYVSKLVDRLRNRLHPESLVSFVSFNAGTTILHNNHQKVGDLENIQVDCEKTKMSTSFEKPLGMLLSKKEHNELPRAIWVFSSGNVQLSSERALELKKRGDRVHLFLYNPLIFENVRPAAEKTMKLMGKKHFHYSLLNLNSKSVSLPEEWVSMQVTPSVSMLANKSSIELQLLADDKKVASTRFQVTLPKTAYTSFWNRYQSIITIGLIVFFAFVLSIKTYLYYRPKKCGKCERQIRFEDKNCRFCSEEHDAYLVGEFNYLEPRKRKKKEIVFLEKDSTEIGTHSRSCIRILKAKGTKKRAAVRIVREANAETPTSFRLERICPDADVEVNGVRLKEFRYLSSGDKLRVYYNNVSFVAGCIAGEQAHG